MIKWRTPSDSAWNCLYSRCVTLLKCSMLTFVEFVGWPLLYQFFSFFVNYFLSNEVMINLSTPLDSAWNCLYSRCVNWLKCSMLTFVEFVGWPLLYQFFSFFVNYFLSNEVMINLSTPLDSAWNCLYSRCVN